MSNNTSNISEHCWARSAGDLGLFITFKIITPFHFFAGLFGNFLCIVAFCRKVKSDTAFTYQIMLTMNQICEILCYAVYAATFFWWSGAGGPSARWFQSCYFCMWFTAHVSLPLGNVFLTNALFLTLATAVDRIVAMWKPIVYKTMNHKRNQLLACIICTIVAAAINVFDSFRFYPTKVSPTEAGGEANSSFYVLAVDAEYTLSLAAVVLSHVRDVVRFSAAIVLIVANAFMIYLYRDYVDKVTAMTSANSVESKKKRAQQKVLVLLAVTESFFNLLCMGSLCLYYTLVYTIPTFYDCESNLVGSIVDGLIEMFEICDFYVVLAFSQTFRGMIAETMPKWAKKLVSKVSS